MTFKTILALGAAVGPLMLALPAAAQEEAMATAPTVSELIVQAPVTYRNRTEQTAPVLEYDLDYFQKFEPLTVGDALKRVPSVAFLSDVLESDGVRLRGLDPGYTQILINGEEVPGGGADSGAFGNGADRAFFVDRIPAELIERVEIVRSASANRSGDAIAGAINIVLRDSYELEGGFMRAGALYFTGDEELKGTLGGVWAGDFGPGRLLVGANVQGRHNPKEKRSIRYDEPNGEIGDTEVQHDVRDDTDYSLNADYKLDLEGGQFEIDGFYVYTDREQLENSIGYAEGNEIDDSISYLNVNPVFIEQTSWNLNGRLAYEMFGGETTLKVGYARFENSEDETETEVSYDAYPDEFDEGEGEAALTDVEQDQWTIKLEHERDLTATVKMEFGLHYNRQERDNNVVASEVEWDPADESQPPFGEFEPVAGGVNTITETRLDPYIMFSGETGAVSWEAGLRYETTDVSVDDFTADDEGVVSADNDYAELLPSAHPRWTVTEEDRIIASIARTIRRPSFTFLSPAVLEGELGDNDFVGDPNLDPETAWGLDIGYERRLGRQGVFGVNVFYRDVKDLIELYNTGEFSDEALGNYDDALEEALDDGATEEEAIAIAEEELTSFVLAPRNTGDGKVWGIEFDLSTPLTAVGMENTSVFFNYSWLDSDIDDELGSRRFNSQSDYVFNVGFTQDLPSWGASFGMTYRKQGDAFSRVIGEEVHTSYDGDLKAFIEKRIGERATIRLTGSNLLDGSKDESFDKFNTLADQIDRDYDEYELESENAGPVVQLIGRVAF